MVFMKNQIPWKSLMAFGFGVLKLSPKKFWKMSLPELQATIDGMCGYEVHDPLSREELSNLMQLYPDERT